MAKKSLIISEKQKYGASAKPEVAMPGDKPAKPKPRKFAPTIELTADQVAAFGLEDAKQGEKGCAMIHYVIKNVNSGGSSYGDELSEPANKANEKVTLSITHVDPDCEPPEGDTEGDDDEADEGAEADDAGKDDDTGGAAQSSADDDAGDDADDSPKAPAKDKVSPKDALGDED